MDFDVRALVLILLLVFAGYWFLFQSKSASSAIAASRRSPLALILGPSGSGKTALFCKLQSGLFRDTISSLKPNRASVRLGDTEIEVVDYPGHDRLRLGLSPLLPSASQIFFLVDPSDKAQLKAGAEKLFDILSNPSVTCPVKIILSKADKEGQKSLKYLTTEIEKEIERMRKSRDGEDGRFLGVDGQDFSFAKNHSPIPVTFASCSAKSGDIAALTT